MRESKYRSILRIRNGLLLLAVALAAGVAVTGWMTFSAPPEEPGTEESEPPAGLSAEPFAGPSAGLSGGSPSAGPSAEASAPGGAVFTLPPASEAPGAKESKLPAEPSGNPLSEASAPGGVASTLPSEPEDSMEVAP